MQTKSISSRPSTVVSVAPCADFVKNGAPPTERKARTGEFTQKELAERIGLDKTTMVVTVDELEEKGLAERRPSSTDRRARVIAVTRAGEGTVAQCQKIIDRLQNEVLESLPAKERNVFLEALGSLVKDRLAQPAPDAPPLRRREPRV